MKKIVTANPFPPIPDRRWDWCAFYEGEEERGEYGYGRTEQEALDDFIENYAAEDEAEERALREREAEALHCGGLSPLGNALVETYLLAEGDE